MGLFKGKAPEPPPGKSSDAEKADCDANGWCWECGGVGYLGSNFGGNIAKTPCRECGGSGRAK